MTIASALGKLGAKPIAKPLVVSSGGTRALDIRARVGTSTSPTSTGTRAVTGVGFQPKVVLPFGTFRESSLGSGATTTLEMFLGAAAGASQAAVSVGSADAVTTSNTDRFQTNAKTVAEWYDGAALHEATLSSFDAGGFTLNWNPANGIARILNHICLGGADLEVSLTQQQMNGTNAAQSFAHGLSGAPTGVLFFGVVEALSPPVTSTVLYLTIGAWANNNQQFAARITSLSNMTTTSTFRALHTNGVAGWLNSSAAQRTMAVNSVDATNVNVTYPVTTSNYQEVFWMLAIRGAKCQVGTFNCNGSLSPLTINTTGITPKLFLPVFVPDTATQLGTVLNNLVLSIGASDGTNNASCGITDANGVTTTNARRFQSSTTLCEYNTAGTKSFEGTAAFSGESVVLTPTTAAAVFGTGGYLVIGS